MDLSMIKLARRLGPARHDMPQPVTHNVFSVDAINLAGSPPTITLSDEFGATYSNVVWPANAYTPVVGHQVIGFHAGDLVIVHGTIPAN
jgi:hypothetical protein